MKKKEMKIKVETLTNGDYSLSVGNDKYLYYSPEELALGVMVHVGGEYLEPLTVEDVKKITDEYINTHKRR